VAVRGVQNVVGMIQERDHPTVYGRWEANVARELELLSTFAAA
jgi:hypothetical protein